MVDRIEPLAALILLTILVAWWLALGIRDRRRARRAHRRAVAAVLPNLCAVIWVEGATWCVCTRPYEHTGPCMDDLHRVIRRAA